MFAAAERILLRDGPHALTSRAVTTEAGVAKDVLHRHYSDAYVGTLAPTLLGASHLLFADRTGAAPEPEAVRDLVTAVIAGVVRDDIPGPRDEGIPGPPR